MPDPEISIIIVSWNVRDLLVTCLQSLSKFVLTPHEVIIVDNHSTDGTIEVIERDFPGCAIIRNAQNEGFAKANNQGWQRARGKYMCFLNPDTEFIEDPFPNMVAYAQQHPRLGCLGPEMLNPNRTHQQSVRRFPSLIDQALVLLKIPGLLSSLHATVFYKMIPPLARYFADPGTGVTSPKLVDQVMGAAMFVPRLVLEDAGSFDEGYWIWFEEVDLCRRLQQRGYDVVYLPTARIVHHGGQSFAQHYSLAKQVWFMRSLARYVNKYWAVIPRAILFLLMPVSYVLTMFQSFFKPR